MKPLTLIALIAFVTFNTAAANDFEYTLDASARSYSAGLSVTPTVGYKFLLWNEADSPLAGTIKPSASTIVSPATYGGRVGVTFSPVTFFHLSANRNFLRRFSTFDKDSCRNNNCVGSLHSTDVSANLLFKFNSIIGSLKFTKVFYDAKDDKSQSLVDPNNYTLVSPNKEISNQIEALVGTLLNDSWAAGVLFQHAELQKNNGNQNGQYLVALKKNGHTSYIAGAGRFESMLKPAKPSFIFTFKYDWQ